MTVPELRVAFSLTREKAIALCTRFARQFELVEWKVKTSSKGRPSKAYGFSSHNPNIQTLSLNLGDPPS